MGVKKTDRHIRVLRFQLAFAVLAVTIGALIIMVGKDVLGIFYYDAPNYLYRAVVMAGLLFVGYGISALMMLYLRGDISFAAFDRIINTSHNEISYNAKETGLAALLDAINETRVQLEKLKSAQVGALGGDREDLVRSVKSTLTTDVTNELEDRFAADAADMDKLKTIRRLFDATNSRLQNELSTLARRGNLNLVIGSVTTALAVGLLAYMVLGAKAEAITVTALLTYYIPRVSVAIFIEVFAFFFLRLYKTTLQEIRLYQSDMTQLAITGAAIESAWASSDSTAKILLSTELLGFLQGKGTVQSETKSRDVDPRKLAELLQDFARMVKGKFDV